MAGKREKINIGIIGYSRFGSLWSKLLRPYGNISIWTKSPEKIKAAEADGFESYNLGSLSKISECHWLFIAVAISKTEEVMKKVSPFVAPQTLVMDVCSVKILPCKWLKKYLPAHAQLCGTHPLFGPDSIKTGIKGKQFVVCPLRVSAKTLFSLQNVLRKIGLVVVKLTPKSHDQQSAYSLAMVHFLGRAFEKMDLEKISIKTLGFEKLLGIKQSVANDSRQLFIDLESLNPYAKEVRTELISALKEINNKIAKDDHGK